MNRAQLVDAARELNEVLGLEPEIDVKVGTGDLREKIKEAIELITPHDRFSEETFSVLKELGYDPQSEEAAEEEREPEEERELDVRHEVVVDRFDKVPVKTLPDKRKTKKWSRRYKGSLTEYVDNLMLAGISWQELKEKTVEEGIRRGTTSMHTIGQLRQHAKSRAKSGKYRVEMDNERVKLIPINEQS